MLLFIFLTFYLPPPLLAKLLIFFCLVRPQPTLTYKFLAVSASRTSTIQTLISPHLVPSHVFSSATQLITEDIDAWIS